MYTHKAMQRQTLMVFYEGTPYDADRVLSVIRVVAMRLCVHSRTFLWLSTTRVKGYDTSVTALLSLC